MSLSSAIDKLKSSKMFKNKKVVYAFVISLLVVAAAICLSSFSNKQVKQNKTTEQSEAAAVSSLTLQYSKEVSSSLQNLLMSVDGLSNVKVVVIVESSPKIEYLFTGAEQNQTVVYDKQSSVSRPAVVRELLPKINGILIVARGANNVSLKNKLMIAISATYGVDISRIDILEGK
ncbi:MAG: hypothetical protein IJ542_03270 [Clostridia bacterium]|nr:hypothetical protein [Clostridia bacterium]